MMRARKTKGGYIVISPHTVVKQMTTPTTLFSVHNLRLLDRLRILFCKRVWFRISDRDARRLGRSGV